jgi:hypothetical protein
MLLDATDLLARPVAAPLRDVEKAWIHTCQQHESRRQLNSIAFVPGSLPHQVLSGLERALDAGKIRGAHVAVLVLNGQRGHPPNINCAIAYHLWTEAMHALAAETQIGPEPLS